MDLTKLREQINSIDDEIVKLYAKRLDLVKSVAEYKAANGIGVTDETRENEIIYRLSSKVQDGYKLYVKELYSTVFTTCKAYQSALINKSGTTADKLKVFLKEGARPFPVSATVACQGVAGSNAYAAATRLFPICETSFFKSFDGVFSAVDKGLCEFGVLPIENSTAGSVNEVYDLMRKYDFHIVKSVRLKINHCLAGVKGANLSDIKTVASHPQALYQCEEYVRKLGAKPQPAENTATAAKELALCGDLQKAVLCSEECADIYGLTILDRAVQDNSSNYTRFICICKDLRVYEGCDKISVMTSLSHKPGSLNKTLGRFAALGLDLTKIESRPIMSSPFEFMFYFDFEGNVLDEKIISLIAELENASDNFVFLGGYKEIF